jgi:hypothetical protein
MNTVRKFYQSIAGPASVTIFLLLIPLLAMQFSEEVVWTLTDFLVAGTLLFGTGLTYKLTTRKSAEITYRIAIGLALFTGLLLIWINLAVGIIGSEGNPLNLLYLAVLAVGIVGTFISRFKSKGMALTVFSMAIAQTLVAIITLILGIYQSASNSVTEILGINGFFIALFLISALLFRYAARNQSPTDLTE